MVGIVELVGKAEHAADRPERDVALRPVDPHAKRLLTLVLAVADNAAVGHGGGVGTGIRAGQSESGNLAAVGQTRQVMVLLFVGAEQHQELAGAERVGHDDRDRGRRAAGREPHDDLRIGRRREALAAIFLGNDQAEEAVLLHEGPDVLGNVALFEGDVPVVEHGAQLVGRPVDEGLFLRRQRLGTHVQELVPVGIAAQKVGFPPDGAGLERLALGVRHGGQNSSHHVEQRARDVALTKGESGHGHDAGTVQMMFCGESVPRVC